MIKVPVPETKRAILWNTALQRPTRHRFVTTMECTVPQFHDDDGNPVKDELGDPVGGGPAWEFIFECLESGEQRRWGLYPRQASVFDKESVDMEVV